MCVCVISCYVPKYLKAWKNIHTEKLKNTPLSIYSIHKRTYKILQNVVHDVHSLHTRYLSMNTVTVPSFNKKNTVTHGKPKAAKTRK